MKFVKQFMGKKCKHYQANKKNVSSIFIACSIYEIHGVPYCCLTLHCFPVKMSQKPDRTSPLKRYLLYGGPLHRPPIYDPITSPSRRSCASKFQPHLATGAENIRTQRVPCSVINEYICMHALLTPWGVPHEYSPYSSTYVTRVDLPLDNYCATGEKNRPPHCTIRSTVATNACSGPGWVTAREDRVL